MSYQKTDNSFLKNKVQMRLKYLPDSAEVLDCFAGDQKIWNKVMSQTEKLVRVTPIEIKKVSGKIYLKGDNLKFLPSLKLEKYNVIDLDAYGSPFKQLDIILDQKIKAEIFCTFIQTLFGGLNYQMLLRLGYTLPMIRKCPTLFFKNGKQKFLDYLSAKGVKKIHIRSHNNKNYIHFSVDNLS